MLRLPMPIPDFAFHLRPAAVICGLVLASLTGIEPGSALAGDSWPQWRGPNQNGDAGKGDYPIRWDEQTNVMWKTSIQGKGGSTPVVSGATAYLTTGFDGENRLVAISIDDGTEKWTKTIGADRGLKHRKGGGANPSPVTKDDLVYAYFRSGDLGCVNSEGEIQWQINVQEEHGPDRLKWDLGTSLLMTQRALVIAVVQEGDSYLLALDPKTGDQLWKVDRNLEAPAEANDSYATPVSVEVAGREAIAVLGADHLTLHDAADGNLMGKIGGLNPGQRTNFRSIASPVVSGDYVVCPYSRGETVTVFDTKKLVAGEGNESIVWFRDDVGSDVPTPAIFDDQVIFVGGSKKQRGTVSGVDLETGKTMWSLQVPLTRHDFSSSPLVAGQYVYVTGEEGTTHVIGPLDEESPRVISSNSLGDDEPYTTASPIAIGDSLIIRTKSNLYRIGS
ncbi:outer membrane biogenesis protein BamB [Rubripirellula obstinata]|uniref:Outer membrane biogenesis protein BamB n=1 Tax=Rubripirellula obstinata TaxID=406547 RepID=A0A5B1CFU3_9BACT|nr:PQQ-binding-like beta-propeller repeat protein [Rubripirellula obstinata]KAA1260068.1 outer membrane biogenesis protein BamB [Rubripirellula obstinata]